ncbi:MAG: LemA family protein [Bacteroidota bacterium]|nr:LemA family protein [Bacteroidota bacterium]
MQKYKKFIPWVILGILIIWCVSVYNGFVSKDVVLGEKWGKVQSAYQLRADKIKQLVSVVKGSAKFEKETLLGVVEARAGMARQATFDPTKGTAEDFKKYESIQRDLMSNPKTGFNIVVEQYPQLRTTDQYKALMYEISETENMIKTERDQFTIAVKEYNTATRRFPGNLFASIFGFSQKEFFAADTGTDKAPIESLKELEK